MLPLHYLNYLLLLGAVLFAVGALGVLWRRGALMALMAIEIMLNAANLTLLTFARAHHDMHGQAFAFLVIAIAAAEAAIGLAIVVGVFRNRKSTELDELTLLKY